MQYFSSIIVPDMRNNLATYVDEYKWVPAIFDNYPGSLDMVHILACEDPAEKKSCGLVSQRVRFTINWARDTKKSELSDLYWIVREYFDGTGKLFSNGTDEVLCDRVVERLNSGFLGHKEGWYIVVDFIFFYQC